MLQMGKLKASTISMSFNQYFKLVRRGDGSFHSFRLLLVFTRGGQVRYDDWLETQDALFSEVSTFVHLYYSRLSGTCCIPNGAMTKLVKPDDGLSGHSSFIGRICDGRGRGEIATIFQLVVQYWHFWEKLNRWTWRALSWAQICLHRCGNVGESF